MTSVSELQKGHEMVVVDSRRLFPFSFQLAVLAVSSKCAVMSVTTAASWLKYDKSNNDYNTNKAEDHF